jgi:HTH-type transcriptional regulator / antitoxin HigA
MIRSNGKMMLTFNRDRYKDLLSEYQPKLIRTEEENEQALAIVEKLMHIADRTPEQQELYELMIFLIEKFEQDFYKPHRNHNPLSMLLFLMDRQSINSSDLIDVFGSKEVVKDVFDGNVQIDRSSAELLGKMFHVDPILFS